ncbi:MAG: hypothetical protein RXR10_05890 [Vulcanisaeta sp.]
MVNTVIIREDRSIVLPDKKLTRTTKGRYAIYLPITLNDLWQMLHEGGVKVTVTIQINPNQKPSGRASGGARGSTWPASVLDLGGQGPGNNDKG